MRIFIQLLIFLLQVVGVILIGCGLAMIGEPLGWIFGGAVAVVYGHLLYRAMESEET